MSQQRASQLVEAGLWLKLSGDAEGARRMFEQALKLDPDNARARQLLQADSAPGWVAAKGMIQERIAPPPPMVQALAAPLPPPASSGDEPLESRAQPAEPPKPVAGAEEVQTLLKGARDLIELDDHTGAIDLIGKAQRLAPNDPDVRKLREKSEQVLQQMFESKLGSMDHKPKVVLKEDEIIWLNLDHRAGFVLSLIDGTVSFEDLFSVSSMSRLDTARILAQLLQEGVIKT